MTKELTRKQLENRLNPLSLHVYIHANGYSIVEWPDESSDDGDSNAQLYIFDSEVDAVLSCTDIDIKLYYALRWSNIDLGPALMASLEYE